MIAKGKTFLMAAEKLIKFIFEQVEFTRYLMFPNKSSYIHTTVGRSRYQAGVKNKQTNPGGSITG